MTGAGISAESGIRTFRDSGGLWEGHNPMDVATPQAWERDPAMVWRFYQARRRQLLEVEPNPAHLALKRLEESVDEFLLVTQNVDDLDSKAGTTNILQMHGRLRYLRCSSCGKVEEMMEEQYLADEFVTCGCGNPRMRPDIVWFGEMPMGMHRIEEAVATCNLFLVVGTSGAVYPAANYLPLASMQGAHCIGVNLEEPENVMFFDEFHQGKAGEILPALVAGWIEA